MNQRAASLAERPSYPGGRGMSDGRLGDAPPARLRGRDRLLAPHRVEQRLRRVARQDDRVLAAEIDVKLAPLAALDIVDPCQIDGESPRLDEVVCSVVGTRIGTDRR